MNKSHGPAFRAARQDLAQCQTCRGRAVIKGIYYEMACVQCNASGWVAAETGEALPLEVLVTQLSMRLQAADRHIEQLKRPTQMTGPAAIYQQNNRRGAGGSNYSGD
ncbi:hypothetical protein [Pseudomonas coronafaciens]|uniref:hypothetical protein n=1 Tax=Pseudomonas coronafaciens TaxID=53409 RepID=UPI000EFF7306|nr:hypothetical protein [Pseudomonas coronafaciens]RMS88841.1 hypothetical protein ALP57_01297 [Pseudomonas coronafaciens pv. oryzae]RMT00770.1 hypothetical protein ALP56_00315 [Pseudomonas coronafaciens pv. oryzae]